MLITTTGVNQKGPNLKMLKYLRRKTKTDKPKLQEGNTSIQFNNFFVSMSNGLLIILISVYWNLLQTNKIFTSTCQRKHII